MLLSVKLGLNYVNFCKMTSLILCSFNGLDRIQTTLTSLSKLFNPNSVFVELIFVDSNSTIPMSLEVKDLWEQLGSHLLN